MVNGIIIIIFHFSSGIRGLRFKSEPTSGKHVRFGQFLFVCDPILMIWLI